MRVERVICGWMTVPAGVMRAGDAMDTRTRLPIPAYLVHTDGERILVDTGPPPSGEFGVFALEPGPRIDALIDLETVTRVVLTHLHWDHCGAVRSLPAAVPVVVARAEWEAAHDTERAERNFLRREDFAPIADRVTLVEDGHDLLGDGAITLIATPGHTPGHQSVRLGDALIIGGDVAIYAASLDDGRLPVFGDDLEAQAQSLRRLRATGLPVTPGHDPEHLAPGLVSG